MGIWFIIIAVVIFIVDIIVENIVYPWIYEIVIIIAVIILGIGCIFLVNSLGQEREYNEKLANISYYETEIELVSTVEMNEKGLNNEPMFSGLLDTKYEKVTIRNGGSNAIVTIYYEDGTNKAYVISQNAFINNWWYKVKE